MNATLPNPFTPLAFLPPDIANQLEASKYLSLATIGAYIWDFLMSLPEEYELIFKHEMRYTQVAYIAARLTSMAFIVTSVVFQVGAVGKCHIMAKIVGSCAVFAVPANTLLFLFRVCAVFHRSPLIVAIFGFLWLSTFATLTSPFSVDGARIGGPGHITNRCILTDVGSISSAGIIAGTVHDTIVFLAIAFRLTLFHLETTTWRARFRAFWSGQGLGYLSQTLLQSGQLYYMATVAVNLLTITTMLTPSLPPVYHGMLAIPNVALGNAMACRVYRKLKLGLIQDHPSIVIPIGTNSTKASPSTIRFHRSDISSPTIDSLNTRSSVGARFNDDRNIPMVCINVSQVTEVSMEHEDLKRHPEDWGREDVDNVV